MYVQHKLLPTNQIRHRDWNFIILCWVTTSCSDVYLQICSIVVVQAVTDILLTCRVSDYNIPTRFLSFSRLPSHPADVQRVTVGFRHSLSRTGRTALSGSGRLSVRQHFRNSNNMKLRKPNRCTHYNNKVWRNNYKLLSLLSRSSSERTVFVFGKSQIQISTWRPPILRLSWFY